MKDMNEALAARKPVTTVAQKDVLLEYAGFGHLIPDDKSPQSEADLEAMSLLWNEIMDAEPKDIDYEEMIRRIRAVRSKYEATPVEDAPEEAAVMKA